MYTGTYLLSDYMYALCSVCSVICTPFPPAPGAAKNAHVINLGAILGANNLLVPLCKLSPACSYLLVCLAARLPGHPSLLTLDWST